MNYEQFLVDYRDDSIKKISGNRSGKMSIMFPTICMFEVKYMKNYAITLFI